MEVVITPRNDRTVCERLRELWQYRELLTIFIQREISIRYKQTAIGVAWAVLQPLISAAIFAVIFGMFAKFPSDGTPYFLFAFTGLMTWQYFSRTLTDGANSFVANAGMLSKVYFPRLLPGLIPAGYGLLDFFLSFAALIGMTIFMHQLPGVTIIMVPLIILCAGCLAYGLGLILAPINAIYRDVSIALPFVIQILMYASPIVFSQSIIPSQYSWIVDFNPIATLVIWMRWAILDGPLPTITAFAFLAFSTVVSLWVGMKIVARVEETLVDRV